MALPTDVIVFSTADWSQTNWTNNQHVSKSLAQRDFRVLYLESLGLRQPTATKRDLGRIGRRLLKSLRGLRHVEPNVWVFSPLVIPMHHRPLVQWINQLILVTTIQLLKLWLGFRQPIIWAYNPIVARFQAQLNAAFLVYHCVDDLMTVPGISADVVESTEKSLVEAADVVFVTSPSLKTKLSAIAPNKVHYFPNVADYDHFSQARSPGSLPKDLVTIPQPRIGFIGAIKDYKLDFNLIQTIAQRHPEWHWVMIGEVEMPPEQISQFQSPNLHFLGYRPYDCLPDYLRGLDVAVLPCVLNDYTRSMFPMKFFEYLAAGKPLVGTRLPSLADYETLYWPTESVDGFEQALGEALTIDAAHVQLGVAAAQTHTWQNRCLQMIECMQRAWQKRHSGH